MSRIYCIKCWIKRRFLTLADRNRHPPVITHILHFIAGEMIETVHQEPDRVGELTWLAYRGRRADRNRVSWGAGGTHSDLILEGDATGRKFCVKIKMEGWKG